MPANVGIKALRVPTFEIEQGHGANLESQYRKCRLASTAQSFANVWID